MKSVFPSLMVACLCVLPASLCAQPGPQAVTGTVSGKVQQVGFRALILKQAIQYNLAGTAQNLEDGSVAFVLQGDTGRIEKALQALRRGTAKSSDVRVSTSPAAIDANLHTFHVRDWTSTSRKITTPHDLVFSLRPDDTTISGHESQKIYQGILKDTLR